MSTNQVQLNLYSQADTKQLAQQLAVLGLTGSVWLSGDLGAGKTTLTRYWLHALGHTGAVKSPTYTLVEPYQLSQITVYHADLYRLQDPEELSFIGFDEYLDDPNALIIIEWASRAESYLPTPVLYIDISHNNDDNHKTNSSDSRQVSLRLSQAGIAMGLNLQSLHIDNSNLS